VAFDHLGNVSGGPSHCTILKGDGEVIKTIEVDGGFLVDTPRSVKIRFDIKEGNCDVKFDGEKILDDIEFGFKIPKTLAVAVCAAAEKKEHMITINNLSIKDKDEHEVKLKEEHETGVPEGCTDYRVCPEAKKLVESDKEETWRCAGHAKVGFGFELTQDADDQEGHLLCRHPFEAKADEIHCTFVYTMKPKNFQEQGGQGLCAYICDPSVPGWDRHFDGSGPLGFVGKKGAILGVGIDCTGTFCEGEPSSVAVKRAQDNKLLCDPVVLEGGVATKEKSDYWRKVHIKFDIEKMEIDVKIGGQQVLKDIKIDLGEGVKLPKIVCIGVCAGTADGLNNHICINKLKLKSEE